MGKVIAVMEKPKGCASCPFNVKVRSILNSSTYCSLTPPEWRMYYNTPLFNRRFVWRKCPLIPAERYHYEGNT